MNFEQKIVPGDAKRTRLWVIGAFTLALLATLFDVGQFLADALFALRFPWELDYGEGIVWEQMRLMIAGRGYGAIDGLPAIVFHYPPVYHFTVAAIAGASGFDQLSAGRLVSIGATCLIALFAGLIAARTVRAGTPARTALLCGLVGGLTIFCFTPITYWAPMMRVDMLSIALSFAGLFMAMSAWTRPSFIVASAALFVAAVFTKQTAIVAPAAAFLTFLVVRPKLAWMLAGSCVGIGLVVLVTLSLITNGGFLRHIVLYNANRFDASRLSLIFAAIMSHSLFVVAVLMGAATRLQAMAPRYRGARSLAVVRQRLLASPDDVFFLLILLYGVLAFLTTFGIAKSGSNVNYFMEWMAVMAILLGIVARDAANAVYGVMPRPGKSLFANPVVLPLLLAAQAMISAPLMDYSKLRSAERVAKLETLRAMVRSVDRPIISDDMVLLIRSGAEVQWEPAIFAELASTGTWNEAPFVARVRAKEFAFFITASERGERLFDSRYIPAVADAMDAAYPVRRRIAGYTLHFPAEALR